MRIANVMRKFSPCAVMAVGLLFWSPVLGQELGTEWTALAPEDAAIIIQDLSLKDKIVRHLRSRDEGYRYTLEVALWTGPLSRIPVAQVYYYKLFPGYHFRTELDPKAIPMASKHFADEDIDFAGLRSTNSPLGRVRSRRFHVTNIDCVSFVLQFGTTADGGGGTNRIYGFYCADPGVSLTDKRVDVVLGNIGVRGVAVP